MPDFEYRNFAACIVDAIDDPIASRSHPIAVGVAGEFFRALRTRIFCESLNSLDQKLTERFRGDSVEFLSR